jgi:hypothetical protein
MTNSCLNCFNADLIMINNIDFFIFCQKLMKKVKVHKCKFFVFKEERYDY